MDWIWAVLVAVRGLSPAPDDQWATRLTDLDRTRAVAFARADPTLLDDVYVPGSDAQRTDATTIDAYARRGGRVRGAELRILTCRLVRETPGRADLEVVDQLAHAKVEWSDGTTTALPRDRPSRRVVTLERTPEGWRMAASAQVSQNHVPAAPASASAAR
jgi:hypothetical protein